MIAAKLKQFLDKEHVPYESIRHAPAYTSSGTAAAAHVHGDEMAKVVMVKVDGRMAMAVLPSTRRLRMSRMAEAAQAHHTTFLINEQEFAQAFPDCEPGAMPPFGNLYGMDVYVDEALADDRQIAFNAGAHDELIRMTYADYQRLAGPKVANLSE